MSQFNCPPSAMLKQPFLLPDEGLVDYDNYASFARTRINYLGEEQHAEVERLVFGQDVEGATSAFYFQSLAIVAIQGASKWRRRAETKHVAVVALGIWVNTGFFGDKHADLIPYAVDHEIYEARLMTGEGATIPQSHLAARQFQFNRAQREGKADKMLDFYLSESPSYAPELLEAYSKATLLRT